MREALRNDGVCLCADSDRGKKEKITLDVVSRSICLLDAIHDLQGQGRDTLCVLLNWLRWAGPGTLTDSDTQHHSTVFIQRIIIS